MRRFSRYIIILCLYAVVYMVLVENFSWLNFGIGLAVSFIAIIFSNKFLLFSSYERLFSIKFTGFIIYAFFLLGNIMASGVKAAILTVTGKVKLQNEVYVSTLPNDFTLDLLANSITLTPGTVTVNRSDSELMIMQMSKEDEEFDFESIENFEKKIRKLVVRESE